MTLRQVVHCKSVVLTTQVHPVVLQEGSLAPCLLGLASGPLCCPVPYPHLAGSRPSLWLGPWEPLWRLLRVRYLCGHLTHFWFSVLKMVCEHWREIHIRANIQAYIVMQHSFHLVTPSIKPFTMNALCHRACVFNHFSWLLLHSWRCWVVPSVSLAFFLEETLAQ